MADSNAELLSHHGKKPYEASSDGSDTAQLYAALARLVALGFTVDTDGQRLKVAPAALLSTTQRDWLKAHKPALVAAVSTPAWQWCVEYPDGLRLVDHYLPEADWRRVAADWRGAAVWPAPEHIDVLGWILERHQSATSGDSGDVERRE